MIKTLKNDKDFDCMIGDNKCALLLTTLPRTFTYGEGRDRYLAYNFNGSKVIPGKKEGQISFQAKNSLITSCILICWSAVRHCHVPTLLPHCIMIPQRGSTSARVFGGQQLAMGRKNTILLRGTMSPWIRLSSGRLIITWWTFEW